MAKDNEQQGVTPQFVTSELEMTNGHLHLLHKIFEEKALQGKEPRDVLSWMIWKEGEEVFGMAKTKAILNNYYFGKTPSCK